MPLLFESPLSRAVDSAPVDVWPLLRAGVGRTIWESACEADGVHTLLQSLPDRLRRQLPVEGVALWRRESSRERWTLCAHTGGGLLPLHPPAEWSVGDAGTACPALSYEETAVGRPGTLVYHRFEAGEGGDGLLALAATEADREDLQGAAEGIANDLARACECVRRHAPQRQWSQLARTVVEGGPFAVVSLGPDQRCRRWNAAATQLLGWPDADVLGRRPVIAAPAHAAEFWELFTRSFEQVRPLQGRLLGERWDATQLPLAVTFLPVEVRGRVEEVLVVLCDQSEVASAQRRLRLQLQVSALVSESASLSAIGRRLLSAVCRELGWRQGEIWQHRPAPSRPKLLVEWETMPLEERSPAADAEHAARTTALVERVRRDRAPVWELRLSGSVPGDDAVYDAAVPVIVEREVQAVLVFHGAAGGQRDRAVDELLTAISRQLGQALEREALARSAREAEEALRQARKMDALGMLAGGIAHDFNNLLAVILGNCELLQKETGEDSRQRRFAAEIDTAGRRAAELTRRLLTFSRRRTVEPTRLQVNDHLRELQTMLQRLAGPHVRLELDLVDGAYPVLLDPVEFQQVMLNLVANARDALRDPGVVTIATRNEQLGLKEVAVHPHLKPGDFLAVSVADTGCGMDSETVARMFEPFFTTKEVQHGTGLGLATVHGIVQRAGGFARVESAPGRGTRCTLYLPRAAVGIAAREVHAPLPEIVRGSGNILVVEDEEALRCLIGSILEVHGYRVQMVSNGREALTRFLADPDGVDLLLTDVMMPEMTGQQLAAHFHRVRQTLPLLLMSGYAETPGADLPDTVPLLAKPFTSDALVQAVQGALQGAVVRT